MKKRIMRYGKVIEATVYREVEGSATGKMIEMHVDSETFNDGIFKREPTDEVIALHKRNTE